MSTTDPTSIRCALLAAGFSPLPLRGKKPAFDEWQKKLETNAGEIQLWGSVWSDAKNTGILTKFTPAIDIDIMVPDAAAAVEELAREWFGEHGDILVQFGQAPKRALLLRTDEPFKKFVGLFTAPDGSEQKIEILGDGQQIVAHGIHPDIHKPYSWHGGEPWTTPREQLPYVRESDLRAFLNESMRVLVENFGFRVKGRTKQKANGDGAGTARERSDWGVLFAHILAGESLHDSIVALAASFVGIGMSEAAAIDRLKSLMDASTAPRNARWRERCAEIPRAVRSALEKYKSVENGDEPAKQWKYYIGEPTAPLRWTIKNILPETGTVLISGQWGTYKTTVAIEIALSVMTGLAFASCFRVKRRGAVLFIALEGGGALAARLEAIAKHQGVEGALPFGWREDCPALTDEDAVEALCGLVEQPKAEIVKQFNLPIVLIVIDTLITAAQHKEGGDNDTAASQKVMQVMRRLSRRTGALVVGIDHFGKVVETGTRGSSAKEGASDTVIALLADRALNGTVKNTRIALRKQRDGVSGLEIPFSVRTRTDPTCARVTSNSCARSFISSTMPKALPSKSARPGKRHSTAP